MSKISPSPLGRLLEEISWEGNARHYREGGRGFENVLTAEVFHALDFLPRGRFLGRILEGAMGGASETAKLLSREVEPLSFSLLPGDIFLAQHSTAQLCVQPDGVMESPSVYCLLETKRIRRGAFQPEQLAREYLAVLQEAGPKRPLLLLILPSPPPVAVSRNGRLEIRDAVTKWLEPVLARCEHEFPSLDKLVQDVDSVIAYLTWPEVARTVEESLNNLSTGDPSVNASVARVAHAVLSAIQWHG